MKLRPPQEVRGFSLEELDLRGRYGVNVLAIRRPKQRFEYADSSTRINADRRDHRRRATLTCWSNFANRP